MLQAIKFRVSPTAGGPPSAPKASSGAPWRHVVLYTLLTYAVAWGFMLPAIPNPVDLLSADRTPAELDVAPVFLLGMFAPTIAAVVMRLFVSKEGLKGSLGPVRTWRYYSLALVVPAVLITLVIGIDSITGWGDFTWDEDVPLALQYGVMALSAMTVIGFLTFGEEYGWRGYLLPKLLPLGEVKAAVIVGLIWGPWHAPLLIAGLNFSEVNPLAAIGIFTVTTIGLSLLLTRLFLAAGGAVLVAALMHGSFNSFSDTLATTDHLTGNPLVVNPGGAVGIALLFLAIVIAHGFGRASKRRRRPIAMTRAASQHATT